MTQTCDEACGGEIFVWVHSLFCFIQDQVSELISSGGEARIQRESVLVGFQDGEVPVFDERRVRKAVQERSRAGRNVSTRPCC